jgi:SAM-dependent methyltransferase
VELKTQNEQLRTQFCDLCSANDARFVLSTLRLDGPLVCCRGCGLFYVIAAQAAPAYESNGAESARRAPVESNQAAEEMRRLAARARELALVEPEVEGSEGYWRELTAKERLEDLGRFISRGRLLEVGCSTGELLVTAGSSFAVVGVEADASSSEVARAHGLECFSGTLFDACFPNEHFDAAALYHVIEHLPSPRRALVELHRILRPGGWLVIETPNIATPWFRLLGARWRQLIPDHRYFFAPKTIKRLLQETGFETRELRAVSKAMSVRLFVSRLSRYHQLLARSAAILTHQLKLNDRTLRLNLGDVMRVYARRQY